MITEQEHEIVPTIRGWLAATSGFEVPTGLSSQEAHQRALGLISKLEAGGSTAVQLDLGSDFWDVLWAAVEVLSQETPGALALEHCDRTYQFVLALAANDDAFGERDQILHNIAKIGWRSAPGGLEAILKARSATWDCGDEVRCREVYQNADQISVWIGALASREAIDLEELREACRCLFRLIDSRPTIVAWQAASLGRLLSTSGRRIGRLDDCEYLGGSLSLIAAGAARHLGEWESSENHYIQAGSRFSRTASLIDLERVDVARLAIAYDRVRNRDVVRLGTSLIGQLTVPRERIKARLVVASALLALNRPIEAKAALEAAEREPAIANEFSFQIWLFTKLGTALSQLGRGREAMRAFSAADSLLARFPHLLLSEGLTASVGEHLARVGCLEEAATLYSRAREMARQTNLPQQVAYLSVLLAELLMMLGRSNEAEAELISVLPLIRRLDLRREAVAAVALLREALAKRNIDVKTIQTLRDQLRKGPR